MKKPRHVGRRIDTFKKKIDGAFIEVPIYMNRDRLEATFYALMADETVLKNRDLPALLVEVEKEVKNQVQITWETFIQIEVSYDIPELKDEKEKASDYMRTEHCQLEFRATYVVIGTKADGTKIHSPISEWGLDEDGQWNQNKNADYQPREGVPEVGKGKVWRNETSMVSLIPSTPENIEAIGRFQLALTDLCEKMCKFMSPDKVQAFLKQSSRFLLTGGKK
jgi:hypothetical protein